LASNRVDVNINGKDSTKGAFTSAAKNMDNLGKSASKNASTIEASFNKAGSAVGKNLAANAGKGQSALSMLGSKGATAASAISSAASKAGSIISSAISKGAQVASTAIGKIGSVASATFSKAAKGAEGLSNSLDSVTGAITGALGGFGLMDMATQAWSGATQREGNKAYLSLNLGASAANNMATAIQGVVAAVPGDDTMMNNLLSTAAARGAAISDLTKLGNVAADYYAAASMTGMSLIEANQDLTSYITTGTTGELQRSRILVGQVDTLENQATVSDRILALNQALVANGYAGLSTMDTAALKFEILKGKFQLALTNVGSAILLLVTPIIDFFTTLDEKTKGGSTAIMVIGVAVGLLGVAIVGLVAVAVPALTGLAVSLGLVAEGATAAAAAGALMELALGPVGLIILGITVAVAAAIVIWSIWGDKIQETIGFLQSGNWGGVAANIGSAFNYVKDAVINAISQIPAAIGSLSGTMVQLGYQLVHWIVDGLTNLSGYLDIVLSSIDLSSSGGDTANSYVDGFGKWLNDNWPIMEKTFVTVFTQLLPKLAQVVYKLSIILGLYILKGIGDGLKSLGGKLWDWITSPFKQTWTDVQNFFKDPLGVTFQVFAGPLDKLWEWAHKIYDFIFGGTDANVNGANAGPLDTLWNWAHKIYNFIFGGTDGNVNGANAGPLDNLWSWAHKVYDYISGGVSGAVNGMSTGPLDDLWNWAHQVYNYIAGGVKGSVSIARTIVDTVVQAVTGPGSGSIMGPADGMTSGLRFNYKRYGNHKDGYPKMDGNTMTGNCFDMTMGLMQMYGGSMVLGTWNGGGHAWWKSPGGQEFDPARLALEGTSRPPAYGPGDNYGGITINGDVYGFDDFQKKVEQANNKIFRGRI